MDAIEPFLVRNYLLFFLLPAWVVVGALDWWTHRRAGIERFGVYEPILHLVLVSLAGLPILLGLFLEINAIVLLAMFLCFLAHEAFGYIDGDPVRGPEPHRRDALAGPGLAGNCAA